MPPTDVGQMVQMTRSCENSTDAEVDFGRERILVTGAGGVLGTALGEALRRRAEPRLLLRQDCDLLDAGSTVHLWESYKPALVFHLAGRVSGIQGNLSFAGQVFYENMLMNLNVIEASRRVGVRKIVAASTAAIYSDSVPLPMRESDLWKDAPHGSEGPYGHAKRAMLAHLDSYRAQYGMDYAYLVCTNLYGPNDRFDETYGHVVPSLISRFHRAVSENRPSITIWGDGTPTRDFLYTGDAAEGFIAAAAQGEGVFNLASGETIRIRELVRILKDVSGYRGEILWDRSRPNGQLRRSYDTGAIGALGWSARTALRDGLARTYAWYVSHLDAVRR